MHRVYVMCDRSGGEIRANVELSFQLAEGEGFSDMTSQNDPSKHSLMIAQGDFYDPAHFDAFGLSTCPGVPDPALSQICVLGYQGFDEAGTLAINQMAGEIGGVCRDNALAFISTWWPSRFAAIRDATQSTMTRQAFMAAVLANFNIED
jgi:hypothetical protein